MTLYALMPVCPANPYLRHLTQYFVGKHPIIRAEAHFISDWGFQIADLEMRSGGIWRYEPKLKK